MKELLDQLRATAERCKQHGEVARMTGIMLAVNDLEAYLARRAPKTTPPTVEAFRKHAEAHGFDDVLDGKSTRFGWLRVRIDGPRNRLRWTWRQVYASVVHADGIGPWIEFYLPGFPWQEAPKSHWLRMDGLYAYEWQWSDADGNTVPGPE